MNITLCYPGQPKKPLAFVTFTGERVETYIPLREFALFLSQEGFMAENPEKAVEEIITVFESIEKLDRWFDDPYWSPAHKQEVLAVLQPIADKYNLVVLTD